MGTLKQGSRGAEVKTLQILLGIKSDGIFGKQTRANVVQFQSKNGLVVDGIVGAKTWAKLQALKTTVANNGKPQTAHFKISEFRCKDGTEVPVEYYGNLRLLMPVLEEIRAAFGGKPVTITSGYRTPAYNKKVGGAAKSQHQYAAAADIKVQGVPPAEVYKVADRIVGNRGGVGKYNSFTHVDVRGYRSRW